MPKLIFLPHGERCPEGAVLDANPGDRLIDIALDHGIKIEHACEMACACTTCHVVLREGFDSLEPAEDLEDDLLDKAWGLEPDSRLACQVIVEDEDLVIEILSRDMPLEDAMGYFDYNIMGAYVGEGTPAFATLVDKKKRKTAPR